MLLPGFESRTAQAVAYYDTYWARTDEPMARGKTSLARGIQNCTIFISSAQPASLYCQEYVYIYTHTHIWHRTACIWITVATK
jgi:hypothetical protein